MEQDAQDKLFDSHEAAKYLKLSEKNGFITVERYARFGRLKGGQIGRSWRFRKQDLDDFVFGEAKQ